ncbi:MAG: hypothetical protein WDM85_08275 [Caulobacteraceae bacterium]
MAALLVGAGAIFESLGLVLLIPILGVVVDTGRTTAGLRRLTAGSSKRSAPTPSSPASSCSWRSSPC